MVGKNGFASSPWIRRMTAVMLIVVLLFSVILSQMVQVNIGRVSYEQNNSSGAINSLLDSTAYLEKNMPERMLEMLSASLSGREDLASAYTMASVYIGREDYGQALGYIERCIELYQGQDKAVLSDLWFKKGCLLTLNHRDTEAISALDFTLSMDPSKADVHYVKMQIHVKQGKLSAAVRDVEMYRRVAGREDMTSVQGDLYAAQETYTEAVAAYDRALQANPEDWHALFMRGLCHLQLGNHDLSLADFSRCIEQGQETAMSHYYRGVLLLNAGDFALAEADFDAALAEDLPGSGLMELWFNRGVSRMAQGRFDEALSDFDQSAARGESAGESLLNSGICLQELGEPELALEQLARAGKEGIAGERLAYYRARSYVGTGQYESAIEAYTICIEAGFDSMECTLRRGAARYALGLHEEAVKDFTSCIDEGYERTEALYYRGLAYAMLGQAELSGQDLEAALAAGKI